MASTNSSTESANWVNITIVTFSSPSSHHAGPGRPIRSPSQRSFRWSLEGQGCDSKCNLARAARERGESGTGPSQAGLAVLPVLPLFSVKVGQGWGCASARGSVPTKTEDLRMWDRNPIADYHITQTRQPM